MAPNKSEQLKKQKNIEFNFHHYFGGLFILCCQWGFCPRPKSASTDIRNYLVKYH